MAAPADRVPVAADASLWLISPVPLPLDQAPRQSDALPAPLADARLRTPDQWPVLAAPAGPAARILAQPQTLAAASAPRALHPAGARAVEGRPALTAPGLAPPSSVALAAAGHAPQDPFSSSGPLPVAPAAVSAAATGSGSSLTSGGSAATGATLALVGALLLQTWRALQRVAALAPPSIVPPTLTPPR
jgi:hypothetical protein